MWIQPLKGSITRGVREGSEVITVEQGNPTGRDKHVLHMQDQGRCREAQGWDQSKGTRGQV